MKRVAIAPFVTNLLNCILIPWSYCCSLRAAAAFIVGSQRDSAQTTDAAKQAIKSILFFNYSVISCQKLLNRLSVFC
jgi:hypothetical protein